MNEKNNKFPLNLFCSLMLLSFIPFFDTLVRTHLLADIPSTDGLGIAGHIEWFDLINETLQAFLIVPLYALLNRCAREPRKRKERIFQLFLVVHVIYTAFAVIVFFRCNYLVSAMVTDRIHEVTSYLRLETIGFLIANTVSFVNVLFVVLEKTKYIYAMTILKTAFTLVGDFFLIPEFGVDGVAYSNIAVNIVCVVLCLALVYREKYMCVSFRFDKSFVTEYLTIGLFGGGQILLDNLIYFAVVCKMVNAVAEQGNYWVANNIIWGLLLLPISALGEIIKKDGKDTLSRAKIKQYHTVILITFLIWLCFIPLLNPFLKNIMGIDNYKEVKQILVILIPFYLGYNYTVLFDNMFLGRGKTNYCFLISAVVNLIYYPIVYGLVRGGIVTPNITFICMMFGFGMVVHLICSVLMFLFWKKRSGQELPCS